MTKHKLCLLFTAATLVVSGCSKSGPGYNSSPAYMDLRAKVFGAAQNEVPPTSGRENTARGIIMETGYQRGAVTLVALCDGTVCVYFSGGGGMIGLGHHEAPARASQELLASAPNYKRYFQTCRGHPLPAIGRTSFYLFMPDGCYVVNESEEKLGGNRHEISVLFHKAHDLITAIQVVHEIVERREGDVE